MPITCKSCSNLVVNFAEIYLCNACQGVLHNECFNWICQSCLSSCFPFNWIEVDEDFSLCLDNYCKTPNTTFHLENIIFNPLELNIIQDDAPLQNIDPDNNYLRDVFIENISSKYFTEEEFNSKCIDLKESKLSLLHLNIRSVPSNIFNFTAYLQSLEHNFSIIGLSETWINETNVGLYNIPGYVQKENFRKSKRGGGVSLYIREHLSHTMREDISIMNDNLETLFIELDNLGNNKCKTIVGVIYRPPNSNINVFMDDLNSILLKLHNEHKHIYIMGDFNINLLNDKSHKTTTNFVDMMFSYSFLPMINRPTRFSNRSATLIDNIFCNNIHDILPISGVLYTDISDHLPVFTVTINKLKVKEKYVTKRLFNDKCKENFLIKLRAIDWNSILQLTNCQQAYSMFQEKFNECFNASFPIVKIKIGYKNRKPWLTLGLKESIKVKNKLYVLSLKQSTRENVTKYKKYKGTLQVLLRRAERDFYNEQFNGCIGNIKKSWELIKEIINKKKQSSKIRDKICINGHSEQNPTTIANAFNEYFVNIGFNLSESLPQPQKIFTEYMSQGNPNTIFLQPATNTEVMNIIGKLKKTCPGYDGVNSDALICSYPIFITTLTHLINLSLSQGVFPNQLKIAKVIPVFKSGDDSIMNNYRPISVLPIFSKIFEHIMHKRLMSFIDTNNILYKYQFGFREKHGTDLALVTLVENISSALDAGKYVLGVFLDLSKAFDTVNHDILLRKLEAYGIRGVAHNWLKSYLSNRQQYVTYNEYDSSLLTVECGVPQGSILGPLLFLLYVNDIVNASPTLLPMLFADDTNLFLSGNNLDNLLTSANAEMKNILDWVHANKLSLNINKTHYIVFRTRGKQVQSNLNIYLNDVKLEQVESTKFLGVFIDSKLSWQHHIKHIKSKIAKSIGIIGKAKKSLNTATLITLYNSFIYPYLTYGVEVWGSANDSLIQAIYKLQKRSIRIISSAKRREHSEPLFKNLKLLVFPKVYQYCIGKMMFKFVKKLVPRELCNLFSVAGNIHPYPTRQRGHLRVAFGRTTFIHKTFKFRGRHLWNELLPILDHQCSYATYRFRLKKYLFDH